MRNIWHIFQIFMAILVLGTCCNISASEAATCTADRDYCTPSNPFFQSGYGGQCTSYAWGRAYEKFDINLSPRGHGGTWLNSTVTNLTTGEELSTGNTVRSNSIAVWSFGTFGHVAFVENVENGRVYFTEANWSTYTDSNYGGGVDNEGNQKNLSVADFETRNTTSGTYNIAGYIYLSNNSCISIYGASATTPATFENFKVGFGIKNNCGSAKTVENVAVSFHEFSDPDNFIQTCYKPTPEISTIIADDATQFFGKTSCNIPKGNLSPKKYKLRYKVKYDGTWHQNVFERDVEILKNYSIIPTISKLLLENIQVSSGLISANNIAVGNVRFEDQDGTKLPLPDNAWIRIVPKPNQVEGNYDGINCKIIPSSYSSNYSGKFGQLFCYARSQETLNSFNDHSEKFQIVIYEQTQNQGEDGWAQWNKEEFAYCGYTSTENPDMNMQPYGAWSSHTCVYNGPGVTENGGNDRDALLIPNGGETWIYGETRTIQWMTQYITGPTVDLYVLHDDPNGLLDKNDPNIGYIINRKQWYRFAASVSNTGSYSLDPQELSGIGNAYMILVVSVSDKSKFDLSDATFTLSN